MANEEIVEEILSEELSSADERKANQLFGKLPYWTTALFALQMYLLRECDEEENSTGVQILGRAIAEMAEYEATRI